MKSSGRGFDSRSITGCKPVLQNRGRSVRCPASSRFGRTGYRSGREGRGVVISRGGFVMKVQAFHARYGVSAQAEVTSFPRAIAMLPPIIVRGVLFIQARVQGHANLVASAEGSAEQGPKNALLPWRRKPSKGEHSADQEPQRTRRGKRRGGCASRPGSGCEAGCSGCRSEEGEACHVGHPADRDR